MQFLSELNAEQRRAVEADDGPLLIIAGPGTGKTKTLTARIVYLIETKRVEPSEILALTFTNKAAEEMRKRIATQLGKGAKLPHIATFHALCYELLSDGQSEPLTFISEHERLLIIKELRRAASLKNMTTRELALELSRLKNQPPAHKIEDAALAKLLASYNNTLKERGLYDFDDLLRHAHEHLSADQANPRYNSILVDEFQDTNALQYELLQLLRRNDNVCVIGDPLQSIYGFRGANSDVFERFQADFPTSRTVTLTINYRSSPRIVAAANAVFPEAVSLRPHRTEAGQARVVEVLNEYSEAAWIVNEIEGAFGGTDFLRSHIIGQTAARYCTFSDFAILYRTHHAGKIVQRTLAESGIPFQVVGEGSPYDQPELWAIIQVLCYLAAPNDTRRKTIASLSALRSFSVAQQDTLLHQLALHTAEPLSKLAHAIAATFGLEPKHMNAFTSTLIRFEQRGLQAYADYIDSLTGSNFYDPTADAVTVMTVHAAKGLEFSRVFLVAAEEGILPHQRQGKITDSEEEKRLFYVALTRARNAIDILYTQKRGHTVAHMSPFVSAIPENLLPKIIDPAMATQKRQNQKRSLKRRQGTLFDL